MSDFSRSSLAVVALASVLLIGTAIRAADGDAPPAREIPARTLPVPTTVSPQMQKAIAEQPKLEQFPHPKDADQWKIAQKLVDMGAAKQSRHLCELLQVTVTPTTLAGVPCYWVKPAEVTTDHRDR